MKRLLVRLMILGLFLSFGLSCNKEEVAGCLENPKADCACILIYEPVCGCNGITYGNACSAQCAGITEFTSGECQ